MSEFLEYVLWKFQNSLVLVLLVGFVAVAAIGITYRIYKRKYKGEKIFPWRKTFLWLIFLGYLVIVLYATILRNAGGFREWNLHLFRAWREAWNNFSTKNWANVLLNIAMFVPLGFLLPLMGKQFRKWYVAIPAGFGTSFAIELAQLALKRGICDVDDLFCNGLIDSIGMIDDDLIQSVDALRRNRKSFGWKRWAGLAACFCLILAAVAAMPGLFAGNMPIPTEQNDFPIPGNTNPSVETIHAEPALIWTAHYNEAVSLVAADRAFIQGIFTEELKEEALAAVKPDRWYEGMDFSGYGIFDHYGNLLDVILTVNTPNPVTVTITDYTFGGCYLLGGEAEVSVCADTEYRLYQYAYGNQVTLGADAVIGGLYFDFCMETTPEELEQAKLDFQSVLECFAFYSEGKPDLSAIVPEEIPELLEKNFETLKEARTEPDFGGYLPTELPDGFAESDIRRFRFGDSNYLSALWSRGLNDLSWVVTHYSEADASRLTGINELENYDLSRYPIPRADSVPEELREIVDDPIFDAEELTLESVYRRAYKVQDTGDTDGWRMRFSVRYGDVLISISSKGVEPEWLYGQLNCLISE